MGDELSNLKIFAIGHAPKCFLYYTVGLTTKCTKQHQLRPDSWVPTEKRMLVITQGPFVNFVQLVKSSREEYGRENIIVRLGNCTGNER